LRIDASDISFEPAVNQAPRSVVSLSLEFPVGLPLEVMLQRVERYLKELGVARSTLFKRLKELGIGRDEESE
jgi:hypothetical protein